MRTTLIFLLLFSAQLNASNILLYNPSSTTVANRVTAYMVSQDTGKWTGTPNMIINPTMPGGVAINDLKVTGGTTVVEMSAGEKSSLVTADAAAAVIANRDGAKTQFDDDFVNGRLLRAICAAIVDQFNTLRQQPTTTFSVITEAQVRTAIRAKLDAQP